MPKSGWTIGGNVTRFYCIYIYTIIDLFGENEFFRAISHRRQSLSCEIQEVHLEQNISINDSMFIMDCQSDIRSQYNVTLLHIEINIDMFVSYIVCKDQKESCYI